MSISEARDNSLKDNSDEESSVIFVTVEEKDIDCSSKRSSNEES